MVFLAVVSLGAALVAVFFASVAYVIGCTEESYSECTPEGRNQLLVALVGLAPALGTVAASVLGRFRPGLWWCCTALVYLMWGLLFEHYARG